MAKQVRFTESSGNSRTSFSGQRVSIYVDGALVFRMVMPSKYGAYRYMSDHPGSKYTKMMRAAIDEYVRPSFPIPSSSGTFSIV